MKIRQILMIVTMSTLLVTGLTACAGSQSEKDNGDKITVVTTLFPQYDFTKQIAGDYADVELLLPPGVESHTFEPTPSDIITINKADLFIYTGKYMEAWAEQIIEGLDTDSVNVLDVSKNITLVKTEDEHASEEEVEEHEYDPHIWTDPMNAKIMVENILAELIAIDPEHKDEYTKNAQNYLAQLDELDQEIRDVVNKATIKTIFFGGRFALYYFAKEYNLDYIAAYDSCSSETEPSARLVADIVTQMKEKHAPVIFYEELVNPKAAETISQEVGAKTLLLHSCHNVSKEDLKKGVTYISLMKQNVENLKIGLAVKE